MSSATKLPATRPASAGGATSAAASVTVEGGFNRKPRSCSRLRTSATTAAVVHASRPTGAVAGFPRQELKRACPRVRQGQRKSLLRHCALYALPSTLRAVAVMVEPSPVVAFLPSRLSPPLRCSFCR